MNDLEEVASLLAKPEPSEEVAARSRSRLQHRTLGYRTRSRGARVKWFMPGVALVAAGAAAAVVIATGAVTNGGAPAHVIAAAPVSGKEVLLMAAVSAERTPPSSGTYWHVTAKWLGSEAPPPMESWTSRDGKRWTRDEPGDTPGAVVPAPVSLRLKGADVSFDDLEKLPTDPEALKAWIVQRKGNPDDMSTSEIQGNPTLTLLTLITELPTPAEVRSAAFRALAATPGVENMGAVEGGQALRMPDPDSLDKEIKMVVDPETARVVRANLLLGGDGGSAGTYDYIAVTTDWTDELPATPNASAGDIRR